MDRKTCVVQTERPKVSVPDETVKTKTDLLAVGLGKRPDSKRVDRVVVGLCF